MNEESFPLKIFIYLRADDEEKMMKEKKKEKEKNLNEKTRRFDGCSKLQDASKMTTLLLGAEAQARHLTASETIPT